MTLVSYFLTLVALLCTGEEYNALVYNLFCPHIVRCLTSALGRIFSLSPNL